jgi:hypothetical protein
VFGILKICIEHYYLLGELFNIQICSPLFIYLLSAGRWGWWGACRNRAGKLRVARKGELEKAFFYMRAGIM